MEIGYMILLFLVAAVIGIIIALLVRHSNKMLYKKMEQENQVSNTISASHIQDLILPNNMGRSIEKVISTLNKENANPQFYVDCFPKQKDMK